MRLGLKFLYAFVVALLFAHVALCGGGFLLGHHVLGGVVAQGFCNRDGLREKVEKHLQEHIELYEKERKARQPTLGALWLFRWAVKVDSWRERKASWRVVVAELWDELWDG